LLSRFGLVNSLTAKQGHGGVAAAADQQVTFPVPGDGSVFGFAGGGYDGFDWDPK
jgi:hypothetical protein